MASANRRLHDIGKRVNDSRNPQPISGIILGSMFTVAVGFIPLVGPMIGGYIGGSISSCKIRGSLLVGLLSGLFAGPLYGLGAHELAHLFEESGPLGIYFYGTIIYMGLFAMIGGAIAGVVNEDEHVRDEQSQKSE